MKAIGLNPIRLDRIGLDPIRINAIKLGVPGAASGSDRPYIDPEVLASLKAVCICYGKSNDDPDRAIVKNLVDTDNPFVISNAAYKLNSGFGKYSADFESFDWTIGISQKQHNKATISLNGRLCNHAAIEVDEMKVNIIGDVTELIYWYIANPDDTARSEIRLTSGINTLPKSYAKDDGQTYNIGFAYISGDSEITIEQIPSFEGAFVTDGIDDLITSTKTLGQMVGESGDYTIISMIHQLSNTHATTGDYGFALTNYIRSEDGYTRSRVTNIGKTAIYGYYANPKNSDAPTYNNILGDKADLFSETNAMPKIYNDKINIQGFIRHDGVIGELSKLAWYWTVVAKGQLTTDQINQVIAYFNLDRCVEPTVWYDVQKQGLTNETPAADWYLKDFSKNGFNMSLFNFAKKLGSGIGKYETDFSSSNYWNRYGIISTSTTVRLMPTATGWILFANSSFLSNDIPSFVIDIEGLEENRGLKYYYTLQDGTITHVVLINGVNTLPADLRSNKIDKFDDVTGFKVDAESESNKEVYITQIPSHAGALCFDGVDDFGQFVGDLGLKDYTIAVNRAYDRIVAEQAPFIASISTNGQAPFLMEYLNSDNSVYPHSFGTTTKTTNLNIQRQISYQSTYVYNGNTISKGTSTDTGDGLTIGNSGSTGAQYAPLVLWNLLLFPYSMNEFLIERQLKKRKGGTLYPDMVEFRPKIKSDERIKSINYYIGLVGATVGQYYPIGSGLGIAVETVEPYVVNSLKVNGVLAIPNADHKGFNSTLDSKSPQNITMDIGVDSTLVQWNPSISSNAEYQVVDCYINTIPAVVGNYYPINSKLRIAITTKSVAEEVTSLKVNGIDFGTPSVNGNRFTFNGILSDKSPQKINLIIEQNENYVQWNPIIQSNIPYKEVRYYKIGSTGGWQGFNIGEYLTVGSKVLMRINTNSSLDVVSAAISSQLTNIQMGKNGEGEYDITGDVTTISPQIIDVTIDEYIRYEDIVQPYPSLFTLIDYDTKETYSWGSKLKVGAKFTGKVINLLPDMYQWDGDVLYNGKTLNWGINPGIVAKEMIFSWSKPFKYLFDNNAPKCILSPNRLRIPNSSYKILGYIPDLSGNGNHGKINNSAYAGMSGANGYLQNFSDWTKATGASSTDSIIASSRNLDATKGWVAYVRSGTVIPTFKVQISGIPTNGNLRFEGSDQSLANGVNTIQGLTAPRVTGFYISSGYDNDWSNLKIEQIGEYEGAYCLDGVDDFITIPTLSSGGKQVLMKVNWQNDYDIPGYMYDTNIVEYRNYIIKGNKEQIAYENASKTYIDGILNANLTSGDLKGITHNITSQFNGISSTTYIGCRYSLENFLKMSLYDFMLFDEISTDEEIATLNEYIGIEPKVTVPPYYWDAYGRSNMEAAYDRALMLNLGKIPSNDTSNALTANNMAWDLMSGYGGWEFPKFTDDVAWHISPNTSIEVVNRTNYSVTLRKLANTDYFYFQKAVSLIYRQVPFKVRTDKAIKVCWDLHYTPTGGTEQSLRLVEQLVQPNVDTMVTLTYKTEEELNDLNADLSTVFYIVYFDLYTMTENEEVTVTELPLYPNGLCFDGVDDYLLNRNIPVFTDFTVISKRIWLEENTSNKPFIIKGDTLYPDGIKNAFLFEYGKLSTYCFGQNNKYDESVVPSLISYATKQSYNGVVSLVKGSATDTIGLDIAHNTRMVFYKLMLYPKTLTNLEIMFLKNMFEKDEIIDLTNPIFIKE